MDEKYRRKVALAKEEGWKTLNLSGDSVNQLSELPEQLGDVEQLEHLIAYSNNLLSLPDSIGKLTSLKSLNFQSNNLSSLNPALTNLEKLVFLGLAFNKLQQMPDELFEIDTLQVLDLTCNQLESISPKIAKLQNLHRLLLGPHPRGFLGNSEVMVSNRLTSLPTEIGQLKSLRELSVGGNVLKEVPAEIGALESLLRLNLSGNQLPAVPRELGNLQNLTILRLWGNNLTELPPLGKLGYLQELNVRGNLLTKLPEDITALTKMTSLDLAQNRIAELQPSIGSCKSLKELYLEGNQISVLPDTMKELKVLRVLHVRKNNLSDFPAAVLDIPTLEWLDIGRNQLASVPENVSKLNRLEELILDSNVLAELPETLGDLAGLKKLMLQNNRLASLPDGISKLNKLQTLCLSYNKITQIPHSYGNLSPVIHLMIDGNPLVSPPREILKRGTAAILAYLRLMQTGQGNGTAGMGLQINLEAPEATVAQAKHLRNLVGVKSPPQSPQAKGMRRQFKSEYDENLRQRLAATIVDESPNTKWDDVAGLHDAKQALTEAVFLPLKQPQLFVGPRRPAKGILLYGPPGNGKTHLARAVATAANVTFFRISAADLLSKWHGESERLMQTLFEMAREAKPSLVFIDEIDSLCGSRSGGDYDKDRRFKTEFLVQLDGFTPSDGVVVLGATNRPWDMDTAALRRFQKKIHVPLPDPEARKRLFQITLQQIEGKSPVADLSDKDLDTLVDKTDGYTGSDVAIIVQDAVMAPVRELMKAQWFKKTSGPDPDNKEKTRDDLWAPCEEGDGGAEKKRLLDIEGNRISAPRHANLDDFISVIKNTKPTVDLRLNKQYEEYASTDDSKDSEKLWHLYA